MRQAFMNLGIDVSWCFFVFRFRDYIIYAFLEKVLQGESDYGHFIKQI